jgi:hypothetical protein
LECGDVSRLGPGHACRGKKRGRVHALQNPQSEFRIGNGRTGRVPQGGTDGNSFPEFILGEAERFLVSFLIMRKWLITPEEKIVVVFDICSSTMIIEDLTLTNKWQLKRFPVTWPVTRHASH